MRDDFTKHTIDILADRAGNRCSNPACRKPTSGPRTDPTKAVNIGVAAHITAASEGGPRYDPSLTSEQRKHPDNGIWLCQNCAKLIDNDPHRYPVDLLHQWKTQAEQMARDELEQRTPVLDWLSRAITGDTEAQRALRNRQAMLQLVKNTWVKGVLEQSLHGAAMIELGMEERADAVERPWDTVVQMPDQPRRPLPHGTRLIEIFEMNQALLILGEPGSGKTTMLLELARDAVARSQADPARSIPVVFHLSSWAERRRPLADWLVEELKAKYRISKRIGRPWVEQDALLLLLDGLDEVDAVHRGACVEAINEHCGEYGLGGIVVCSRTAEYEALGTKLKLGGAVLLQPLVPQQVDEYLAAAGPRLDALGTAMQQDATLQELAQTPLMLSVMVLAYRDTPVEALEAGQLHSAGARRHHLFAKYVEQMFKRRRAPTKYTPQHMLHWLAWLAWNMAEHSQSVFLMEGLQPSWLSSGAQHWAYAVSSRTIGGLILGLLGTGIMLSLNWIPDRETQAGLLIVAAAYAGAGFAVGLLDGARMARGRQRDVCTTSKNHSVWQRAQNTVVVGLTAMAGGSVFAGLLALLLWGDSFAAGDLPEWPLSELVLGLVGLGLPFGLIWGLGRRGQDINRDVRTIENLTWSWRRFLLPLLVAGIIPGALFLIVTSIRYDPGAQLWDEEGHWLSHLLDDRRAFGHGAIMGGFNPDGTEILIWGSVGRVWLLHAEDGSPLTGLDSHEGPVTTASFSADGTRLMTVGFDRRVWVHHVETGLSTLLLWGVFGSKWYQGGISSATLSPNGTRVATVACEEIDKEGVCLTESAQLWDATDYGMLLALSEGHTDRITSASFSSDSLRLVTASADGTARLWNAVTGALIAPLEGHTAGINSASFSPDSLWLVTAGKDGTAHLWDAVRGTRIAPLEGHTGSIYLASFSPNGARLVTASEDGTTQLWRAVDGSFIAALDGHKGRIDSMSFSPNDTRLVTGTEDGTARLWDAADGSFIILLEGHTGGISSVSFSPDGTRFLTASKGGTVRLWNGRTGMPIARLRGHKKGINSASFNASGTRIVTTSSAEDGRAGSVLWLLPGLFIGLVRGLRGTLRETKSSPNEGLRLTARNAFLVGFVMGLITVLAVGLCSALYSAFDKDPDPVELVSWGPQLLMLVTVLVTLAYGGLDVLHHYLLRLILTANGHMPWQYVRFLDYAAERVLLRKVGGGYIFIHRLLLDYFAKDASEAS